MRPIARASICAVVIGASLLLASGASGAANAPGTIVVGDTGISTQPFVISEMGASTGGIAYAQTAPGGADQTWIGLPNGASSPVPLTALPGSDDAATPFVSGSLAVVVSYFYPETAAPTISWESLDGTSSATGVPLIPAGAGFTASEYNPGVGAAPDGWVTVGSPIGAPDNIDVLLVTTGGQVTDLGLAPGTFVESLVGGPNGVVVNSFDYDGSQITYIPYATPSAPVTLGSSVEGCTEVLTADAVCETQVGNQIGTALVPLDGSAITNLPNDLDIEYGTTSDAVWTTSDGSLAYQSWYGGPTTTVSSGDGIPVTDTDLSFQSSITTDDSEVFLAGGSGLAESALASLTPPSATPVRLVSVGAAPIEATGLAVGPGRAAWTDDAPASGLAAGAQPLWSRSLTNASGVLSAGSANFLGSAEATNEISPEFFDDAYGFKEPSVGVSGARTLASGPTGDLDLYNGTSSTPTTIASPEFVFEPIGALSGARVLYESGFPGSPMLYDSVTGTSSVLSAIPSGSPFALWGDYVAWTDVDGAVWWMDLSAATPVPVQVIPAPGGGDQECSNLGPSIFVSGDYVAWTEDCQAEEEGSETTVEGYRDMTTMAPAVDLTPIGVPVALSNSYVAVTLPPPEETCLCGGFVYDDGLEYGSVPLSAVNLATAAVTPVGSAGQISIAGQFFDSSPSVALDGSTISWIDENGVPEAAPLPAVADPPRFLGDPTAPANYNPSSDDWNAEFDASAPLTACSVSITSGPTPIATLPCSASDMALGQADVAWNGTDTTDTTVANGSYTWTLTASDADGALESASGGPLALTGSVTVTSPASYSPMTPVRICDSRPGNPSGLNGPAAQCNGIYDLGTTTAAGGTKVINVATGADSIGVPPDATSVVLNVTVVNPGAPGYMTVYPTGQAQPASSNLNYVAGQTVPNLVDVGLGTGGDVSIYTSAKSNVIVDVEGYTSPTASGGVGAGLYDPLASPARICDTRPGNPSKLDTSPDDQCNGVDNAGETLGAGGSIGVQVTGDNGIPAHATAAVFNVTVANPAASGYLTVHQDGQPRPTASNVNYTKGQVTSNRVIVPLSNSGAIRVYSSASADVIVDVSGYYTAAGGSGSEFSAEAAPVRVCDTRAASGGSPSNQCTGQTVASGGTLSVQVTGLASVPADATAVAVNLTAVDPSAPTYLTVFPGPTKPFVSDLNPTPGSVSANMVVATVNSSGKIMIYNYSGSVNVVVDVLGWYS
jgi:hypothetical protein